MVESCLASYRNRMSFIGHIRYICRDRIQEDIAKLQTLMVDVALIIAKISKMVIVNLRRLYFVLPPIE